MDLRPTFQGLVDNVLFWVLTAVAGTLFGFLKAQGVRIAEPLMYGFAAFAFMALIFMAVRIQGYLNTQTEVMKRQSALAIGVDPARLPELLPSWVRGLDINFKERPSGVGDFFVFDFTMPTKVVIEVRRERADDRCLLVRTVFSPPMNSPTKLEREIIKEFARLGLQWSIRRGNVTAITVLVRVPITSHISESDFWTALERVNNAAVLASVILSTDLE